MWDSSENLISYIHYTFVTCDDTGLCEAVVKLRPSLGGEKPGAVRVFNDGNQFGKRHGYTMVDEDDSSTSEHSPDIHADVGHRRRSETSKRLETLKLQRLAQSKIRTVQWKEPTASTSTQSDGHKTKPNDTDNNNVAVFTKVQEKDFKSQGASCHRTSAVSKLIRSCPGLPLNPFQEYLKFDGNASLSCPSKSIRVFPLMASSPQDRLKPLDVCVSGTAKVSDLIGLICYHYTSRNLAPQLSTDISRYALCVAEDSGEVDSDLPPRSPHENVSRFHFPYLALVDGGAASSSGGSSQSQEEGKKYFITVHVSTGEKFKLELDSLDCPLRTVRDSALVMRFGNDDKSGRNVEYNLEKLSEPNSPLPLDTTLSNTGITEFVLVRAHSARGDLVLESPKATAVNFPASPITLKPSAPGPPSCNCYTVTMVRKFKRDVKVHLLISTDRLDISPIGSDERKVTSSSSAAKLFRSLQRHPSKRTDSNSFSTLRSKAVSFDISRVGGAEIIEEKSGQAVFRIVHCHASNSNGTVTEWKSHHFESCAIVVQEIVQNVNQLLDTTQSAIRQDFLQRTPRKSSFFKRLQLGDLSFGDSTVGATPQS